MAIEVELPDGSVVEFPDGTDNATMEKALSQYQAPKAARPAANNSDFAALVTGKRKPDFSNVVTESRSTEAPQGRAGYDWKRHERLAKREFTPQEVEGMNPLEKYAYGWQNSFGDLGHGVAQFLTGDSDSSRAEEARHRVARAPLDSTTAAKAGRFTGDVVAASAPMSKIGQLGRLGQYAASAASGAVMAGAQPVAGNESRGANAALGGALGVVGQAGGDVLAASGRAAASKVAPELRALYERAKAAGINLTPAQLSDSEFVKRVATQLGKLPFAGGRAVAEKQQAAGNREIAKLIGQEADSVTPRVMGEAADKIGAKFDEVFAGGMKYDRQFLRELAQLKQEVVGLDDTANSALSALIQRVQSQAKDGAISGRTLQSLDQQARRWATGGGDRQHAAQAFRESLHEAFGRQAPAAVKQTWDTARRQWATLKTLEPVVARNTEGGIPLSQLQNAVNATKAGKTARARGRDGDLGELANIGQRVKAPTSSGTNENQWASHALNPLAWPLLAAAGVGGLGTRATLNNSALAGLLMRQGRGQTRQALSPVVRPTLAALFGIPEDAPVDGGRRP
jgi:hypothetical protein